MAGGYMDKALRIDLGTGEVAPLAISDEDRRLYLGGKGLAVRLLYDHTPAGLDPFDPQMALIFATGPVTGTAAPQSNRFVVATRSPLTGGIGTSTCGGNFATKLRKAGYDLVLITGRAEHPVYIKIDEDKVSIEDARELWGLGARETQKRLPRGFGMAVIGPAGENRVRFAGIVSEERIAGRTGTGAVMGSKNLKAVVANGKQKVPIELSEAHKALIKSHTAMLASHPMTGDVLPRLGTANIVQTAAGRNILPVHNFQKGSDHRATQITGERLADEHLQKQVGCLACPINCGRGVVLESQQPDPPASKPVVSKGPEYETVGLLGSNIGCWDLKKIIEWNELCDDLGMDTISTGGAIAFATELTQKGMLESDLSFESHDGISQLIEDIAHRRGLGDHLAEGVMRMAARYGGGDFAMHVKGLELPAYDARGCYGQGLEYATTNRGGCHVQGSVMYLEAIGPLGLDPHSTKIKPHLVVIQQNLAAAIASAVFCQFASYPMVPALVHAMDPNGALHKLVNWTALNAGGPVLSMVVKTRSPLSMTWFEKFLSGVTGRRMSMGDFDEIGERTFNIERLYNLREGKTTADDTLPGRMLNESTFDGIEGGVPLNKMLPTYYKLRGWDAEGVPTGKTLKRLSIRT